MNVTEKVVGEVTGSGGASKRDIDNSIESNGEDSSVG